jgi:hypothetical protein
MIKFEFHTTKISYEPSPSFKIGYKNIKLQPETLLSNLSLDDHSTIVLQLNSDFLAPVISFFECVGEESFDSLKV